MTLSREERLVSLFARTHAGIRPGLDLMRVLLEALGNPQRGFLCLHVAGTNGKGSVCAILESGVRARGLKSGLFTSPHLVRVNERIRIAGEPVSNEIFYGLLDQVEAVEGQLPRPPTFFETLTAMAFLAFAQNGVQVAVLETGMGGRLDCTNVVEPLLSVITRIDFDHTAYLGNTLEAIASEKAGIIKSGRPVVLGSQAPKAQAVLERRAVDLGCEWMSAVEGVSLSGRRQDLTGQRLTLSGRDAEYGRICFPLLGRYQLENLCTAVAALEWMDRLLGLSVDPGVMKASLEQVRWEGRSQILSRQPPLLLDVAHNPGGALALRELLEELFGRRARGVLFWAGLSDKDPAEFIRILRPVMRSCICMDLQSPRALSASSLCAFAEKEGLDARTLPLSEVKTRALSLVGDADFGCVAGSVYLAGEWLAEIPPDAGEFNPQPGIDKRSR